VEKEKGANVVSQMAKSATKRAMADSWQLSNKLL
jgi:hypothetical protein